jgi:hypothetical protein
MLLIFVYSNKEGLVNYTDPTDPTNSIYQSMLSYDTSSNVITDLQYFNNASNLLYGYQRMPTL